MTSTVSSSAPATQSTPDLVVQALRTDPATWQAWVEACLAERTEDALAGSKAQLQALSDLLVSSVHTAFRAAHPEVQATLRGAGSAQVKAAYHLGQLAFAQLLVSQALMNRADDDFADVLRSERHAPLTQQLTQQSDLNVCMLAAGAALDETQVRIRLKELVSKGICDFRVLGGVPTYFLTHAAKAVLEADACP